MILGLVLGVALGHLLEVDLLLHLLVVHVAQFFIFLVDLGHQLGQVDQLLAGVVVYKVLAPQVEQNLVDGDVARR